jgi:hypothetical protein
MGVPVENAEIKSEEEQDEDSEARVKPPVVLEGEEVNGHRLGTPLPVEHVARLAQSLLAIARGPAMS